jgi:dihydroflavonol-4-reductase
VRNQTNQIKFELVTLNPGGVFGPPLGKNIANQTMVVLDQMLSGKQPVVPNVAFTMVDVRDVAKIQVQALTHPDAANHRFILSGTIPQSFAYVARILKNAGYKRPSTMIAPDFMIKLMSIFDREAKGMLGFLGSSVHGDNSKTIEMFDWDPIPFEQSILESASVVQAVTD